jgi:ribosome biogenesis protein Nip4
MERSAKKCEKDEKAEKLKLKKVKTYTKNNVRQKLSLELEEVNCFLLSNTTL